MSRVEKARQAYERGDLEGAAQAHQPDMIAADEPHQEERGKYLSDVVYGALDGIVTTFAVVAGVTGAQLASSIVLILGMANLLGDGFSMAAGAYIGEKSEQDYHRRERARERWEVEHFPEGEIAEIRDIYRKKGFTGKDLDRAVEIITSDKERWVDTMMVEELNIMEERKEPLKAGMMTFIAFLIAGAIPLISYVVATLFEGVQPYSFGIAVALTSITIFGIGSARSLIIHKPWYRAGIEMLLVGGLAAVVAYLAGRFLRGLA